MWLLRDMMVREGSTEESGEEGSGGPLEALDRRHAGQASER